MEKKFEDIFSTMSDKELELYTNVSIKSGKDNSGIIDDGYINIEDITENTKGIVDKKIYLESKK